MSFEYVVENDSVWVEIKALTYGWLAVGFNDKNEIVGSDLKMFCVKDGHLEAEDQFVRGFQLHPADSKIGGTNNIRRLKGWESEEGTRITFKIPLVSKDEYDYSHQLGANFWLILAYSIDDDFEHHSIMRKHFLTKWNKRGQKFFHN